MWKEALGDEYESPSQCYTMNMQHDTRVNDSVVSRPIHGRTLQYDPPVETETDAHIQALADLCNKKQDNHEPEQYVDYPNTMPADSGKLHAKQCKIPNRM